MHFRYSNSFMSIPHHLQFVQTGFSVESGREHNYNRRPNLSSESGSRVCRVHATVHAHTCSASDLGQSVLQTEPETSGRRSSPTWGFGLSGARIPFSLSLGIWLQRGGCVTPNRIGVRNPNPLVAYIIFLGPRIARHAWLACTI